MIEKVILTSGDNEITVNRDNLKTNYSSLVYDNGILKNYCDYQYRHKSKFVQFLRTAVSQKEEIKYEVVEYVNIKPYSTDREAPLLLTTVENFPVLTIKVSSTWENVYFIAKTGKVTKVEKEAIGNNGIVSSAKVIEYAKENNFNIDPLALDAMIGRETSLQIAV